MQNELSFRLILGLLLTAFVLHRGHQTRRHSPAEENIDRELELGLNPLFSNTLSLIALLSSLAYLDRPEFIARAAFTLPAWLRWLGLLIAVVGFALMEWSQRALASNWSDAPVHLKNHTLTTSGPFRWIRHPIYTAFLLILSAPLLLSANWLVGLSWIAATALDIAARVRAEEAMLGAQFGPAYHKYANNTGRLLPKF
jgi:protein-S-isoprenylcysteine O-methyltransferase Ste14